MQQKAVHSSRLATLDRTKKKKGPPLLSTGGGDESGGGLSRYERRGAGQKGVDAQRRSFPKTSGTTTATRQLARNNRGKKKMRRQQVHGALYTGAFYLSGGGKKQTSNWNGKRAETRRKSRGTCSSLVRGISRETKNSILRTVAGKSLGKGLRMEESVKKKAKKASSAESNPGD